MTAASAETHEKTIAHTSETYFIISSVFETRQKDVRNRFSEKINESRYEMFRKQPNYRAAGPVVIPSINCPSKQMRLSGAAGSRMRAINCRTAARPMASNGTRIVVRGG